MDNDNIKWLTTVPVTDVNFRNHLQIAEDEEIEWAIAMTKRKNGNKTRIVALSRELRKRVRERNKK